MTVRSGIAALLILTLTACTSAANEDPVTLPPPEFDEAFAVGLTEDRQSALLRFESESELAESRGVGWRLEEWNGTSWESEWILAGEAFTLEEWDDGDYGIGDLEIFGVGPDVVPLPPLSTEEYHRVCHGIDASDDANCGVVPTQPTEPNSAATPVPEPTTTVPNDE